MSRKLAKEFMEETGYSNWTTEFCGVRKDYKRGSDWTFKTPEEMLIDFARWLKRREKK